MNNNDGPSNWIQRQPSTVIRECFHSNAIEFPKFRFQMLGLIHWKLNKLNETDFALIKWSSIHVTSIISELIWLKACGFNAESEVNKSSWARGTKRNCRAKRQEYICHTPGSWERNVCAKQRNVSEWNANARWKTRTQWRGHREHERKQESRRIP